MKQQQTTSFKIGIYNFITAMNIISHIIFFLLSLQGWSVNRGRFRQQLSGGKFVVGEAFPHVEKASLLGPVLSTVVA